MSAPDRGAKLDRSSEAVDPVQGEMLGVAGPSVYRQGRAANDNDLDLMRRIGELFLSWLFLRSCRRVAPLAAEGIRTNRRRVSRLMGIAPLGLKPRTSKPVRPQDLLYLLRDLGSTGEPGTVRDIIYLPIGCGFLYLVAIMDWHSRLCCSACRTRWM